MARWHRPAGPSMEGMAMATERKTKKRGQNEGSIYQRADGRWVGVASVGYKNGKRARTYVYAKTRAEVAPKLAAIVRDTQQGIAPVDGRLTTEAYLARWLAERVKATTAVRTLTAYTSVVNLYLVPTLGKKKLAKLTAVDVQRTTNTLLARNLSPTTVRHALNVLRIALGQAVRWGLIHRNVADLVEPPKATRYEVHPLTTEQARELLEAIRGDRHEALYLVTMATGLRQGEAFGLRWDDVDLDTGTITVRHQLQRTNGTPTLIPPKSTRSRRTIALPAFAVPALRAHRARQNAERLAAGARWQDWKLVFTNPTGRPLTPNVTTAFARLLKAAGLPKQRFHDLRHLCASLMLAQGVHPRVVMEQLGHSQISVTMNTYSHVAPALQREAAERMDALLTGTT